MSYRSERQRDRLDERIRRKGDNLLVGYTPGFTTDMDEVLDEPTATHRVIDQTGETLIGFGVIGRMLT
jgi:hypothetical protein